jgi:methionyl-tRNA formyltransferase
MNPVPNDRLPARPKLIFMGTPDFAVPTLQALIDAGHQVISVVTQPDRPKGRGRKIEAPPAKKLAQAHGIEVFQPEKASDERFCDIIRKKEPDLLIVVAFGQILKKKLLTIPKWGVINIHASLLPKLRGAAPIQWAILNDENMTGLTVMQMDEGMDTGPILYQEEVAILENETAGQLHDRLALMAGKLMVRSLRRMAENPISYKTQDHGAASYAPKIEKDLCLVNWTLSARKVAALIRGLDPRPGAYTFLHGEELKLFSAAVLKEEDGTKLLPGRVSGRKRDLLIVETGQGRVGIKELQSPGKKRLFADEFIRGFSIPEGTVLGM